MPHCRTKKVHNITVISEPGGDYVDHSESGESGLAMANYLYEVIVETESKESLLAMGSGKFIILLTFWSSKKMTKHSSKWSKMKKP